MNYDEWAGTVPPAITADALWQMAVYRQALFLGELAWFDTCRLAQHKQTLDLSDQLYRAAGGISATISEGYSRASRKDQARFYEYALGSARETRDWYYKGRHVLGETVAVHRIDMLVHIIRQLLKMVPEHRGRRIAEEPAAYNIVEDHDLFFDVPMP
jgi:four helix bundle protein